MIRSILSVTAGYDMLDDDQGKHSSGKSSMMRYLMLKEFEPESENPRLKSKVDISLTKQLIEYFPAKHRAIMVFNNMIGGYQNTNDIVEHTNAVLRKLEYDPHIGKGSSRESVKSVTEGEICKIRYVLVGPNEHRTIYIFCPGKESNTPIELVSVPYTEGVPEDVIRARLNLSVSWGFPIPPEAIEDNLEERLSILEVDGLGLLNKPMGHGGGNPHGTAHTNMH